MQPSEIPAPETILRGGRFQAMVHGGSIVNAVGMSDGEIVATGSDDDVADLADQRSTVVELRYDRGLNFAVFS
jgi:predicted amidohydrolase YtcJ